MDQDPTTSSEIDGARLRADQPLPFRDLPPAPPLEMQPATDTVAAHEAKGQRRPPGTIWRRNPRDQGLIGLTDALAWFGAQGWNVCVPLIDNQPYDLVVDDGTGLKKVQVKTTTYQRTRGIYCVSLCTNGGNQSFHTRKTFEPTSCDLLYVLTDARTRYLIPTSAITAKTSLSLGGAWSPIGSARRDVCCGAGRSVSFRLAGMPRHSRRDARAAKGRSL